MSPSSEFLDSRNYESQKNRVRTCHEFRRLNKWFHRLPARLSTVNPMASVRARSKEPVPVTGSEGRAMLGHIRSDGSRIAQNPDLDFPKYSSAGQNLSRPKVMEDKWIRSSSMARLQPFARQIRS
jgi:hypothetical protein